MWIKVSESIYFGLVETLLISSTLDQLNDLSRRGQSFDTRTVIAPFRGLPFDLQRPNLTQ